MKTFLALAFSVFLFNTPVFANENQSTNTSTPVDAVQVSDHHESATGAAHDEPGTEKNTGDHHDEKMAGHKCDGSCGHKECKQANGSHSCGKSCNKKNCKHHQHSEAASKSKKG